MTKCKLVDSTVDQYDAFAKQDITSNIKLNGDLHYVVQVSIIGDTFFFLSFFFFTFYFIFKLYNIVLVLPNI